jgi:hypothetical protein
MCASLPFDPKVSYVLNPPPVDRWAQMCLPACAPSVEVLEWAGHAEGVVLSVGPSSVCLRDADGQVVTMSRNAWKWLHASFRDFTES